MQNVRIITRQDLVNNNSKGTVYVATSVSVNFDKKLVSIWNGAYWEDNSFDDIFCVATWEDDE